VLYTYVAIAALAAALAFGAGWKVQAWRYDARELAREVNQRAVERMRRQNADTAAVAHETDKVTIKTEFVPVIQEVERVVNKIEYRDRACLDDDGLRALNAAARTTANPGQPGHQLPAGGAAH